MKATSISNDNNSNKTELQDDISRLPRDCLMTVLKLTSSTPKHACRFAAVCTTLQSMADSDDVWESFLPVDLSSILCRAEIYVRDLPVLKKKLYLHLCHNWISFYGGTKRLRLDLLSGAKIILLHKQHPSVKDWIEIHCSDLSPNRNYAAYIIFAGTPTPYSRVLTITQCIYDSSSGYVCPFYSMDIRQQESQTREDGWREIKLREFNTSVRENRAVRFFISDKYTAPLRNKLTVVGIEVRPVC